MLYVINILYYLIADLDLLLVISCYSKLCYGVKIVLSQDEYLLPTTSKPLIYLRFLKSYNYTPTKLERSSTFVGGLLLCLCACGMVGIFITGNPITTLESKIE